MVPSFQEFFRAVPVDQLDKTGQAKAILWFLQHCEVKTEADIPTISDYFDLAQLPRPNSTRLRQALTRDREVVRGTSPGIFKLSRSGLGSLTPQYAPLIPSEADIEITAKADVYSSPFLSRTDVDAAFEMGKLYVVLHCFENSVRYLIEDVLSRKLGLDWWDRAASAEMKRTVTDRRAKEAKNKWLTPRGGSALFYIDWGDLVKLIRKFEADFLPRVQDLKFVELRLEELERLRNIVAHHGVLPDPDDFQRVVIAFRDWCKQVA